MFGPWKALKRSVSTPGLLHYIADALAHVSLKTTLQVGVTGSPYVTDEETKAWNSSVTWPSLVPELMRDRSRTQTRQMIPPSIHAISSRTPSLKEMHVFVS